MIDPSRLMDRIIVAFDSKLHQQAGGDIEDNAYFWRLARVISYNKYPNRPEDNTVDVIFIGSVRPSYGHLVNNIKYCPNLEKD